jgi:hypothetical protein
MLVKSKIRVALKNMSTGLKWFLAITVALIGVTIATLILVRSHDGPLEIFSGGPFQSGELVENVQDWGFLVERSTIELQTMVPPRSRTMWIVVHNNRPYVISAYMTTNIGKVWKQWPRSIEEDNRAIVRAGGKLYQFNLVRRTADTGPVLTLFNNKYRRKYSEEDVVAGNTWLFELVAR